MPLATFNFLKSETARAKHLSTQHFYVHDTSTYYMHVYDRLSQLYSPVGDIPPASRLRGMTLDHDCIKYCNLISSWWVSQLDIHPQQFLIQFEYQQVRDLRMKIQNLQNHRVW